ncbi:MAG: AMP-binding protein [Sandaracinaceae bacterium]|nr:AMP-binding protein [Sandaracinaceae bacterium]
MSVAAAEAPFIAAYRDVVAARGAHLAIEDAREGDVVALTHAALWSQADALARALGALGIGPEDVVALSLARSSALVVGMLAVWRAGAAWVVVEPSLPAARRARLVALAGARAAVEIETDRLVARPLASRRRGMAPPARSADDALAYVAFTSGSSGEPKGVRVEHGGLLPMLRAQIEAFALDAWSRALWVLSPSFDASVSDVGTALLAGATLLIDAPDLLADPRRLRDALARREVSTIDLPPSVLTRLDAGALPGCLRTVVIGGEVADTAAVRRAAARVRVVNVYGPTEATVCTSLERCLEDWRGGTIGAPLPHVRYRLEQGELWIGGRCLARDYAGDLGAERFVWRDGTRWYRTGDRVRRDGEAWVFEGRLDRQVQLAGRRAEPEEVEAALRALGVEAAVIPDATRGHTELVAFVASAHDAAAERTSELRRGLEALLPAWLVPSRWVEVDALPRTAHGKIDLAALAARLPAPAAQPWPRDPEERRIARLYAATLGLASAGPDDDFFALGGDSLALLTLLAHAEREGLALSASQVHATPGVRALAQSLARGGDPERRSIAELGRHVWRVAAARVEGGAHDTLVLTGATGSLGVRLRRALSDRGHRVLCLVRAPSDEAARARVGGDALAADVSRPQLGLSQPAFDALAARAACIVHLAARVCLAASYEALAPVNVEGTAHALAFAARAGAPIVYASTLSVFVASDRADATYFEDDDAAVPCTIAGGYAQTKWVAEQLVRRAEVPATIVRYGLLTPDRERHRAAPGDWLARFVRELAARGAYPRGLDDDALAFDATPLDHAVDATARLIERQTRGTFHVAGARAVAAPRLLAALRRAGARLAPEASGGGAGAALGLGAARAYDGARHGRHRALDLFAASGVRFDDARARAEGVIAPAVDDDYLHACVRAMLEAS